MAQHYVELEKELGNALQERLKQFEHAQISRQAKQLLVHLSVSVFHRVGMRCRPNHVEPLFQQVIIPSDRSNTMKTK